MTFCIHPCKGIIGAISKAPPSKLRNYDGLNISTTKLVGTHHKKIVKKCIIPYLTESDSLLIFNPSDSP